MQMYISDKELPWDVSFHFLSLERRRVGASVHSEVSASSGEACTRACNLMVPLFPSGEETEKKINRICIFVSWWYWLLKYVQVIKWYKRREYSQLWTTVHGAGVLVQVMPEMNLKWWVCSRRKRERSYSVITRKETTEVEPWIHRNSMVCIKIFKNMGNTKFQRMRRTAFSPRKGDDFRSHALAFVRTPLFM